MVLELATAYCTFNQEFRATVAVYFLSPFSLCCGKNRTTHPKGKLIFSTIPPFQPTFALLSCLKWLVYSLDPLQYHIYVRYLLTVLLSDGREITYDQWCDIINKLHEQKLPIILEEKKIKDKLNEFQFIIYGPLRLRNQPCPCRNLPIFSLSHK